MLLLPLMKIHAFELFLVSSITPAKYFYLFCQAVGLLKSPDCYVFHCFSNNPLKLPISAGRNISVVMPAKKESEPKKRPTVT